MTSVKIVIEQDGGAVETVDELLDLVFRALIGCGYHSAAIIEAMREFENEYGCANGESNG